MSKWLTNKLKDLPDPPGLFVKNTQEFVEKVKDIQLAQDEVLVSFDVEALYPSVPNPVGKTAGRHLHKGSTAVHGADTFPV
jgi:hypothetical protein